MYGGKVSITYFNTCGVYVLSSGKEFALFRGNLADFLTLPASSASARNPIHTCPHLSRLARSRSVGRQELLTIPFLQTYSVQYTIRSCWRQADSSTSYIPGLKGINWLNSDVVVFLCE